jgi:bacterioferritin-associated ferredoxin
MYVCLCKGVTDGQIIAAIAEGAASVRDVRDQLGVMTECGKCACLTRDIVRSHQRMIGQNQTPLWAEAS